MKNDEHEIVREKALEILSFREHSRKELREKLVAKKFPKEIVEAVVSDLAEKGIVDDARFAASLVRGRLKNRPCGERGLVSLLRAKGLAPEDSKQLVKEIMKEEGASEEEMARRFVETKLGGRVPSEKILTRVGNQLLARGFDARLVRKILWEYGRTDLSGETEGGVEELRD